MQKNKVIGDAFFSNVLIDTWCTPFCTENQSLGTNIVRFSERAGKLFSVDDESDKKMISEAKRDYNEKRKKMRLSKGNNNHNYNNEISEENGAQKG